MRQWADVVPGFLQWATEVQTQTERIAEMETEIEGLRNENHRLRLDIEEVQRAIDEARGHPSN